MAPTTAHQFEREALEGYVCHWTIKWTGQPEPLVLEVLGWAGRWLDDLYEAISRVHHEVSEKSDG